MIYSKSNRAEIKIQRNNFAIKMLLCMDINKVFMNLSNI